MTRKREFLDYLADIEVASQHIAQFMAGMTWEQFAQDQKMRGDATDYPPCSRNARPRKTLVGRAQLGDSRAASPRVR